MTWYKFSSTHGETTVQTQNKTFDFHYTYTLTSTLYSQGSAFEYYHNYDSIVLSIFKALKLRMYLENKVYIHSICCFVEGVTNMIALCMVSILYIAQYLQFFFQRFSPNISLIIIFTFSLETITKPDKTKG